MSKKEFVRFVVSIERAEHIEEHPMLLTVQEWGDSKVVFLSVPAVAWNGVFIATQDDDAFALIEEAIHLFASSIGVEWERVGALIG